MAGPGGFVPTAAPVTVQPTCNKAVSVLGLQLRRDLTVSTVHGTSVVARQDLGAGVPQTLSGRHHAAGVRDPGCRASPGTHVRCRNR
jgi:hypothetical protein